MKKLKLTKRITCLFVIFIILGVIGLVGCGDKKDTTTNIVNQEALKVSELDLVNAFSSNEIKADKDYNNKIVEISGVIHDIHGDSKQASIGFFPNGAGFNINFIFSDKAQIDKLANLKIGDKATIKGKISGRNLYCIIVDKCMFSEQNNTETQNSQITKQENSTNDNTNKSNSNSTNKNQNGISDAGIQISETNFEVYQDICPRLRAHFKLKNISNSTIYLNSESFCLRQDGGNAINPNTSGGGYSYNNGGTLIYELQPIHLKTGDTCDVSFDFNLNEDKPNLFELYYVDPLGNLVLLTKIS